MKCSRTVIVACAVLSLTVAASACGSDHASSAADTHAASRASTASAASPGVVAGCTSAPPYRLSVRPGSVTLACADDGLGVEDMTWGSWSSSAAAGQGRFWEKLCQPNCAEGKTGTYPVTVTLSAVKSSASG